MGRATTSSTATGATTSPTLGGGDDEFIWDPGDGSDTIEGARGHDVMTFNGAAGNETFAADANGAAGCASPATSATS